MREVYENYRLISERKTSWAACLPSSIAIAGWRICTTGLARWRWFHAAGDIFTILGMTYADKDLIQIQENVITRAIASLDFNAK